jgi:hypothetical protein
MCNLSGTADASVLCPISSNNMQHYAFHLFMPFVKCLVMCVQSGVDGEGRISEDASAEQIYNGFGTQFVHLVQSFGFQLINVNNVAIQLKVCLSHVIVLMILPCT